ncbi:MAG: peptidylprolyl isomerase [Holosporales bacterium]|nr:peptidylprolyl isomerase [Holosporales bacterium]
MSDKVFCSLRLVVVIALSLTNVISDKGYAEDDDATASSTDAASPKEARITAVVNGSIITKADIDARLALLAAASGARISDAMIPQLRYTILQALVEEQLKVQEARRIGRLIKRNPYVTAEEEHHMLTLMIRRSGLSVDLFEDFLKVHNIPKETIIQQARAQAAWHKIISDLFGDSVQLSDKEVERVRTQFIENKKRGSVLLSRIVIPFDTPEQQQRALADMKRITSLLKQGANFATLAQQFSRTPEACKGGALGWVTSENLTEVEKAALQTLPLWHASAPILKQNAYVILLCQDKRPEGATTFQEITFQRFFIPAPYAIDSQETASTFVSQAHEVRDHLLTVRNAQKTTEMFSGLKVMEKETLAVEDIDPKLRTFLNATPTGDVSPPIVTPDGVLLLAVYARADRPIVPPTIENVRDHLRETQLEKLAERYLRMLKRTAYIEMRE